MFEFFLFMNEKDASGRERNEGCERNVWATEEFNIVAHQRKAARGFAHQPVPWKRVDVERGAEELELFLTG
jgi:hypothetical protein